MKVGIQRSVSLIIELWCWLCQRFNTMMNVGLEGFSRFYEGEPCITTAIIGPDCAREINARVASC